MQSAVQRDAPRSGAGASGQRERGQPFRADLVELKWQTKWRSTKQELADEVPVFSWTLETCAVAVLVPLNPRRRTQDSPGCVVFFAHDGIADRGVGPAVGPRSKGWCGLFRQLTGGFKRCCH